MTARKSLLSASDPVISAGVMTANMRLNMLNVENGIEGARASLGLPPTPSNMKYVIGEPTTPAQKKRLASVAKL